MADIITVHRAEDDSEMIVNRDQIISAVKGEYGTRVTFVGGHDVTIKEDFAFLKK